jgi:hypothetical protein
VVDHDEPHQSRPQPIATATATTNGAESSRTLVRLEDGAVLLTCRFRPTQTLKRNDQAGFRWLLVIAD